MNNNINNKLGNSNNESNNNLSNKTNIDVFEKINNNAINRQNINRELNSRNNIYDNEIINKINDEIKKESNIKINNEESKEPKRRISIQKIFNLISFIFILTCIIYYGFRFIKYYNESHKKVEQKFIADIIKENNNDNDDFKNINSDYYFYGNSENNYLKYSNLIWRIIKVNNDGSVTLILNNPITILANGENKDYKDSYINEWLNSKNQANTGIFYEKLSNPIEYLIQSKTCIDEINSVKSITCKETFSDSLITIPSLNDYASTGGSKSFMNSEEAFYLLNSNNKNQSWYVDGTGKVDTIDKSSVIGVKPVITLKKNIILSKGNGTKEEPYEFDSTENLFATYIKLGNDLWQVYDIDGENLKLSLTSYIKLSNSEFRYKYSNTGYYHDDTKYGTLAYYLNHTYLNSLPYKDLIIETEYSNGIYENYDYKSVLNSKVSTKVALPSIGNIFLNNKSNNYYTSTGVNKNSNQMYVMNNDFKATIHLSTETLSVIPVISINKNNLTKGNGTIESPYEV